MYCQLFYRECDKLLGNYNFSDGMYINYDNNYMNRGYSSQMMPGIPAPAPGYGGMVGGCPLMCGQGMNMMSPVKPVCPMMYTGMQYSPMAPVNNMYGGYSGMNVENYPAGINMAMVAMRPVSIQEIQD
jgi:hypothetical protein